MEHHLKICVSKEPEPNALVVCRQANIRERLLNFLLGKKRGITVIVSGETVEEVAIKEVKEGGNQNGKGETNRGTD